VTELSEEKLREEAIKAATHYSKVKFKAAMGPDHFERINACAAGFFMGVRWLENQLKEKEHNKQSKPKGDWL
jgi:hypothetical protein